MPFTLRTARDEDISTLQELIRASVRTLQAADYSFEQREGALVSVFGVDRTLIHDGTYFVIEQGDEIVACGGWSRRKTLYGSDRMPGRDDDCLNPQIDAAKIRAFFVHPDWSRRGLGKMLLQACEAAAMSAGFTRFELGATLTGIPLYRAYGFVEAERREVPLPNGASLPIVRMTKEAPLVPPR
ncbi:MAG: GNAT family N-acetyltransferase [Acidobacteriaceae bacterium]|nr:GNAT family N-acetyltransferase [Acidobacteriaceae bacterium]